MRYSLILTTPLIIVTQKITPSFANLIAVGMFFMLIAIAIRITKSPKK